jgi:hypothetical protein
MADLPKSAGKHFNMQSFAEHNGMDSHEFPSVISKKELNFCGTTACALGWAATIPSFKRAGLALTYRDWMGFELSLKGQSLEFGWDQEDNIKQLLPGITPHQAEYLFGWNVTTKTPKEWARRCRNFLKKNA